MYRSMYTHKFFEEGRNIARQYFFFDQWLTLIPFHCRYPPVDRIAAGRIGFPRRQAQLMHRPAGNQSQ